MMKNKTWEKDKRAFDLLVADTILDLDAKKINKARAIGIIIFGMANLLAIKEEPLFIKDLLKKEREKMGKALRMEKEQLEKIRYYSVEKLGNFPKELNQKIDDYLKEQQR